MGVPMNKNKNKGTAFETAVVRYLSSFGIPCERRTLHGALDQGDISGLKDWVIECKDEIRTSLGVWAGEAATEAKNAGVPYGAVVHKRRQRSIDESYVTMPLWAFAALYYRAYLEGENNEASTFCHTSNGHHVCGVPGVGADKA